MKIAEVLYHDGSVLFRVGESYDKLNKLNKVMYLRDAISQLEEEFHRVMDEEKFEE
jgi:hypothetical protein